MVWVTRATVPEFGEKSVGAGAVKSRFSLPLTATRSLVTWIATDLIEQWHEPLTSEMPGSDFADLAFAWQQLSLTSTAFGLADGSICFMHPVMLFA